MTRTELITIVNSAKSVKTDRLAHCSANVLLAELSNGRAVDILQSYATRVAIFSRRTGTVYVLSPYSSTTYKHIYKFANIMSADRITWLYDRSDHVITTNFHGSDYITTKQERKNLFECDYNIEIENFLK